MPAPACSRLLPLAPACSRLFPACSRLFPLDLDCSRLSPLVVDRSRVFLFVPVRIPKPTVHGQEKGRRTGRGLHSMQGYEIMWCIRCMLCVQLCLRTPHARAHVQMCSARHVHRHIIRVECCMLLGACASCFVALLSYPTTLFESTVSWLQDDTLAGQNTSNVYTLGRAQFWKTHCDISPAMGSHNSHSAELCRSPSERCQETFIQGSNHNPRSVYNTANATRWRLAQTAPTYLYLIVTVEVELIRNRSTPQTCHDDLTVNF